MNLEVILVAILGSGAFSALVSGLFTVYLNRKKSEDGVRAGVRILMYDRIKHLATSYIARGYVTFDEYEDLVKMHSVYHNDLGGNGFLDRLMDQVSRLPKQAE